MEYKKCDIHDLKIETNKECAICEEARTCSEKSIYLEHIDRLYKCVLDLKKIKNKGTKKLIDSFDDEISYFQQLKNMMIMGQSTRFTKILRELDNQNLCKALAKIAVESGNQSHFTGLITKEILNRIGENNENNGI